MTTTTTGTPPAAPLRPDPLPGERVHHHSTPGWERHRRAWNLAVDQRPVAVTTPRDADEVAAVLRSAAASGQRVAVQRTGHGAATLPALDDVVLLRTDALTGISVDADRRRARVGAGLLVRDLVTAADEVDLAFPAGSSATVGVVGYTLGGGVGWLARSHGLACNHVLGAEVVTADGTVRWIDHEQDPDLFWALRGGGGSFAVVTALEVALSPLGPLQAGRLLWPLEAAEEVLHAWRVWTAEVPDTVTSIARLLRFPPLPTLPEHLRGQRFACLEVAIQGDEDAAGRELRALRALRPVVDTVVTQRAPDLLALHGDPEDPVPAATDHRLVRDLPAEAVDALLAVAGPDADSPLLATDLRHLGGALARSAPGHGVLDRLAAGYALFGAGIPVDPDAAAAIDRHHDTVRAALAPWDAGQEYLNFADRAVAPSRLFEGERFARLQAVRALHDPEGRLVANHTIPLPGPAPA